MRGQVGAVRAGGESHGLAAGLPAFCALAIHSERSESVWSPVYNTLHVAPIFAINNLILIN